MRFKLALAASVLLHALFLAGCAHAPARKPLRDVAPELFCMTPKAIDMSSLCVGKFTASGKLCAVCPGDETHCVEPEAVVYCVTICSDVACGDVNQ